MKHKKVKKKIRNSKKLMINTCIDEKVILKGLRTPQINSSSYHNQLNRTNIIAKKKNLFEYNKDAKIKCMSHS